MWTSDAFPEIKTPERTLGQEKRREKKLTGKVKRISLLWVGNLSPITSILLSPWTSERETIWIWTPPQLQQRSECDCPQQILSFTVDLDTEIYKLFFFSNQRFKNKHRILDLVQTLYWLTAVLEPGCLGPNPDSGFYQLCDLRQVT